ncbi:MAG: cysteine--tRNA ligase [Candidatus Eremiobacteraeota bacterium]|nr:cysteine--tRNA ligase [Candidatus Eremiobacteraeota bacterium]MBC5803030.1 cysteine--tRNA ligase [Candidatus Eremiobacteraeota bacterium]MBC5821337.1 cysteine--tRNA ligase [Candidatus Eremiobacteraeota bacterium]
MSLQLYNTRTRAVEPFAPVRAPDVTMYVCGLTPSAEAHLGHARSFLFFDVLRRYLVHLGYRVTYVRNVTDIDDRSIATAQAEGVSFSAVVARHLASFNRSMDRLHVLEPDHEPHATAYIGQIVAMIGSLIDGGHAYVAADGVYYAVGSFACYGALSGRNTDELLIGARIAPGEDKRDPLDFALWKFAKAGEPAWASPWGAGRPGWHIECSAMSHALLGEPLDIHGGGFDLIFPHHENEIAQTEALYGGPMANMWVHGGLLLFDGKKMSKSLGNFEPLSDLLDRHDAQAIRLLFLQAGYRKPLNFTEPSIEGATSGLRRLQSAYDALRAAPAAGAAQSSARAVVESYERRFFVALDDDMNTSAAVAVLFDLTSEARALEDAGAGSLAAAFMHEALGLIGLDPSQRVHPNDDPHRILHADFVSRLSSMLGDVVRFNGAAASPEAAIAAVIKARNRARLAKDFRLADRLRIALSDVGVHLHDTKEGTTWTVVA